MKKLLFAIFLVFAAAALTLWLERPQVNIFEPQSQAQIDSLLNDTLILNHSELKPDTCASRHQ